MRRLSLDHEEIQSEDFFDLEEDPKNSHNLLSTKGKAPIDDEISDDEPIPPLGYHLGLMIASTPQGRFVYLKGSEPPQLLGLDARLVAYIPDHPY